MENNSGFSLMELAIAIAIFGLLSAIAIPNYISWRDNSKFSGSIFNLVSDLSAARQSAIRRNTNVVISFSQDSYTAFVDDGEGTGDSDGNGILDGFGNGVQDGDELMLKTGELPPGITFNTVTFSGDITRFDGRGRCPSANVGSITITGRNNTRTVEVNRLGHISVI